MSKKKQTKVENKTKIEAFYGTKSEWIIEELEGNKVRCKDERGEYITDKSYVDAPLLDPNRMYRVN